MSRIAVRQSNGDDVEKILPLLAPLASAASAVGGALASAGSAIGGAIMSGGGMALRGAASLAGKTSLGQGITAARGAGSGASLGSKLMTGAKAAGKAHMKNKVGMGEGGEGGEGGGQENLAGKFVAQQMQQQADKRQQANQQSMQNNQAMAEKAKANSQITTGEPMDMSWRLLKDWHWNGELSPRERKAIVERARMARKKGNHAHMESVPSEHHDDQFAERYHPHQKMPLDAAGLDPHEIATAMGDMYLENHPELKQALDEELPHPANPNQTNTPGMVFHALRTDNPKISNNTLWDSYSPVITRPSAFSRPQVHSAINSPAGRGSGKRHTIRISSVRDYPHSYSEHNNSLPSKFNLVEPLSDLPVSRGEAEKLRQDYRIRQLGAGEEKWRNKILDVEDKESDKIEEGVINQLAGQSRMMEQQDAKAAKQRAIEAEKEQASAAKEQSEMSVTQNQYMPGFYNVTDPAYDIRGKMIGPGMHDVGEGYDYYHNHFQQNNVQTGEPMDLAWRMLKQMSDDDMQEWAYDNLRNQGITIPDEREEEVIPKPEMPTLYY